MSRTRGGFAGIPQFVLVEAMIILSRSSSSLDSLQLTSPSPEDGRVTFQGALSSLSTLLLSLRSRLHLDFVLALRVRICFRKVLRTKFYTYLFSTCIIVRRPYRSLYATDWSEMARFSRSGYAYSSCTVGIHKELHTRSVCSHPWCNQQRSRICMNTRL